MWKKNSLNGKILSYFLIFSFCILSFLWMFQVLFLDVFYQYEKTNDILKVADKIKNNYQREDFTSILEDLAFDNEVCVEVTSQTSSLFESNFFGKGCMREERDKKIYMDRFIESNQDHMMFQIENQPMNNKVMFYALKLDDNQYAFIHTSIRPIDSTAKILQKQLIIVTIIVFLLSFVISFFISKHLSLPIITLNNQTKSIAKGDFSQKFDSHSNISELNELSDTLNYTRIELGKTEELRRDLMANVSHDLKTPLTMIKAYAEMSMDLHEKNAAKRREDMNIIISEVDRLTLLVEDILNLSKMQSNIEDLNYEDFDFISFTQEILKRYQFYQETENYKIDFVHDMDSIQIHADKKKIEQVIYNLINNAINYTGDDNYIKISISKNENSILVEISDTGKGIKEEDIPYIWDRYYKNKKKHKRNLVGTGLGLSIVKSILESHKFPYGVKSKINKGTTFYFEIPNKKED